MSVAALAIGAGGEGTSQHLLEASDQGAKSHPGIEVIPDQSSQQAPNHAPSRRALLIGIDDYTSGGPQFPNEGARWRDLNGAVHDAVAMRELLLSEYGFSAKGIMMLLDRAATREAILDGIKNHLLAPADRGDEVIFFYAGHGSQVPNPASQEADGLDESLVPADSNLGADDLRDKELARLFNQILGRHARFTIILDSCHSGSGVRSLPPKATARFLPPSRQAVEDSAPTGGRPEEHGALVLAAAQDFEFAIEAPDETNQIRGVFSSALLAALGRALPGESAEATFLRARALLQAHVLHQQPVLAGQASRLGEPILGRGDAPAKTGLVAIQRDLGNGAFLVQGGWIHGLEKGVELTLLGDAPEEIAPKLRITRILSPSSSEARLIGPSSVHRAQHEIGPGDLARVSGWTSSNEPALKVWIPDSSPWKSQLPNLASQLRDLCEEMRVSWVADPSQSTPTHLLYWHRGAWWLAGQNRDAQALGPEPSAASILAQVLEISEEPSLFMHLPPTEELGNALELGEESLHDAVERVGDPERAHYQLVGKLDGNRVRFAWVRPGLSSLAPAGEQLPSQTKWCDPSLRNCGGQLTSQALRLAKIRAWLTISSPWGGEFPYRFALRAQSGELMRSGTLFHHQRFGLVLEAHPKALQAVKSPRYIYFFTIDSAGNSRLLYPRASQGSVENRFPVLPNPHADWPRVIEVGPREIFGVGEPFGSDTYFLLSTEEPIPNPWVVQFRGVRSHGPRGQTPLEELLSQTGSSSRGTVSVDLPTTWSLERLTFQTRPSQTRPRPAND